MVGISVFNKTKYYLFQQTVFAAFVIWQGIQEIHNLLIAIYIYFKSNGLADSEFLRN